MTHNRSLHHVWAAAAVFILALAAFASSTSAEDLTGTPTTAVTVEGKSAPADGIAAVLRFLDFVNDTVGSVNQEQSASPHEPPGQPPDRPPDPPGQNDPPNPPGQPPDRPPDQAGEPEE